MIQEYTIEGPDGKSVHLMPVMHSHWFVCAGRIDLHGNRYPDLWRLTLPDGRIYQGGNFYTL